MKFDIKAFYVIYRIISDWGARPMHLRLLHSEPKASVDLAPHNRTQRSRKALLITLTEESAMAAAAISGDSMSLSAG